MRVLHIINSLETGGAQRLISDLLPTLKRQGMDVSLLVFKQVDNMFSRYIQDADIPIISLDAASTKSLRIVWKLRHIMPRYDIVHVHLFPASYWAALASIGMSTKLVWTEHSTSNKRRRKWYFRPIEKYIYSRYRKIISISRQTQDNLQQWLESSDERFMVIENGVNLERFRIHNTRVKPKSLIMVSRFVDSKDQDTVIRAMALLNRDYTLRFVGNGPRMQKCKALATDLGVADRIEFLGERTDIAELISQAHIGIQSSKWEGFGLTAVEMMAMGKPVIASDVNGLRQVVEGAGYLFEAGNATSLKAEIEHICTDSRLYQTVSQLCIQRSTKYSLSQVAEKHIQQYKGIYDC